MERFAVIYVNIGDMERAAVATKLADVIDRLGESLVLTEKIKCKDESFMSKEYRVNQGLIAGISQPAKPHLSVSVVVNYMQGKAGVVIAQAGRKDFTNFARELIAITLHDVQAEFGEKLVSLDMEKASNKSLGELYHGVDLIRACNLR